MIAYDAADLELDSVARAAPAAGVSRAVSLHFKPPAATARVRVRLELPEPNATFTVDNIVFTWQP